MLNQKDGHHMQKVYDKNVKVLQKFWKDYENEDLEAIKYTMAENYEGFFYPINNPKGIKSNKTKITCEIWDKIK